MNKIDNNEDYIHTKLTKNKTDREKVDLLNKYYGFEESALDLEMFFKKHIKHQEELKHFLNQIGRISKSISMRNINVELAKYNEKYKKEVILYTQEEINMIEDLMHYWGE